MPSPVVFEKVTLPTVSPSEPAAEGIFEVRAAFGNIADAADGIEELANGPSLQAAELELVLTHSTGDVAVIYLRHDSEAIATSNYTASKIVENQGTPAAVPSQSAAPDWVRVFSQKARKDGAEVVTFQTRLEVRAVGLNGAQIVPTLLTQTNDLVEIQYEVKAPNSNQTIVTGTVSLTTQATPDRGYTLENATITDTGSLTIRRAA